MSRFALRSLAGCVGRTPLFELGYEREGRRGRIFAEWEAQHLTGSIKDRMALRILEEAAAAGELDELEELVEASSGNTGISFAAMGRALGLRVTIAMPDWMSRERSALIGSLGARVVRFPRERGGFVGAVEWARSAARARPHVFCPRPFDNPADVRAHRDGTAVELLEQLGRKGAVLDGFVAGVGTGGTIMGFAAALGGRGWRVRATRSSPPNPPSSAAGRGCARIGSRGSPTTSSLRSSTSRRSTGRSRFRSGRRSARRARSRPRWDSASGSPRAPTSPPPCASPGGSRTTPTSPRCSPTATRYLSTDLFAAEARGIGAPGVRWTSWRVIAAR